VRTVTARRRPPEAAPAIVLARDARTRAAHLAIRRRVFVLEQAMFEGDDADARDTDPATLLALGLGADGEPAGVVRLYPLDGAGLWRGDRLAVLPAARHTSLGAALVRFAVRTAGELGGRRMEAMVQLPNVRFFETLGWSREDSPRPFHGVEHQPMAIGLSPGR
jgi:putative N-acetyltransferase (TIGR04045 family)